MTPSRALFNQRMRGRTCKGNRLLTPPAVPRVGRMKRTLVVSAIVATVLTASVTLSVEARTHPASRGYQKHHAPTPTPSPARDAYADAQRDRHADTDTNARRNATELFARVRDRHG